MPIATFSYPSFIQTYPQFRSLNSATLELFYRQAGYYWRNDGTGPCVTDAFQADVLNLLTAHIAQLFGPLFACTTDGTPASGLVGRISSASEGSVSVSAEFPSSPNGAWFLQTPYGAMYWQMTAAFRTMRYVPGHPRNFEPVRGFPALFPGRTLT